MSSRSMMKLTDRYDLDDGTYFSGSFEKEYHPWTIQDAEEGDILCYKDEIFVLKSFVLFSTVVYYCCYDNKNFIVNSIYSLSKEEFNKIHPATKEQRNLLFQKIREAGYEWDSDKKELIRHGQ